jgi:hypothetical protein
MAKNSAQITQSKTIFSRKTTKFGKNWQKGAGKYNFNNLLEKPYCTIVYLLLDFLNS